MMRRGFAILVLLLSLVAKSEAGTVSADVTLSVQVSGRFRSSGYVTYRSVLGFETNEPVSIIHFIQNTDAYYTTQTTTPYSRIITSSMAGSPPNCYRAQLDTAADDSEAHALSADEFCYDGPPPPPPPPGEDQQNHPGYEPLILDLNGDGIQTTRLEEDAVLFDLDADGVLEESSWTSGVSEDGFLWLDRNRNHRVDNGAELFGDATFLPSGRRAQNGVEALAFYDKERNGGNGDGTIDRFDAVWRRLQLWVDRNHDGIMTRDENDTLAERRVVSISLDFRSVGAEENSGTDPSGNWHFLQGTFRQRITARGESASSVEREIHDVAFRVK